MKIFLKKAWQYVVVAIWFVLALIFFEYFLNRGNTDLTKEMSKASLPVIDVSYNGHFFNRMYGYTSEMDYSLIRDGITPLEEGRVLNVRIHKYDSDVESIKYELRSADKDRFVEEGEIKNFLESSRYIDAAFSFKDIIKEKTDYSLKIILELKDGKEAYYYARVFINNELNFSEKLDYVYYFDNCTFDKETALDEIGKYMESNSSGDNTNFAHIDIHSSMDMLTWGNLVVEKQSDTICTVMEIDSKSALMKLEYLVNAKSGEDDNLYLVKEYFRFIKGSDRMYLMSFDRYMNALLFADDGIVFGDKLMLGVVSDDYASAESEDGNTFAFINGGSLYVVNSQQNTFGTAYSFYDKNNLDDRCIDQRHGIRILNIDESGNVLFYVYGYFNRGDHEGKCGIHLFEYNSKTNVVCDRIFIETDKPYEVLKNDIGKLAYANTDNELYFYLDEKLYLVNIEEMDYEIIASDIRNENFFVSPNMSQCAWVSKEDALGAKGITFRRLDTSETYRIDCREYERIKALGFMGDDLIVGEAHKEDIYEDVNKEMIFPMYEVYIINKKKEILKKYSMEDIFVMSCKINDNLITLSRVTRNEEGTLISAAPDSIVNTLMEKEKKNLSETVVTENLKKIIQVTLKKEMDNKKTKYMNPKTEVHEGQRVIEVESDTDGLYFVFKGDECKGITRNIATAIKTANAEFGCVVDHNGHYIWKKENYRKSNQISRIEKMSATEDEYSSLEECIETVLSYEGFSLDVKDDLNKGVDPSEILEERMSNCKVFEIDNCESEVIKYYLNKDIPVIALAENNTLLVVGYSESGYVWLNPKTGNIIKANTDEAESFYENNGFRFITYVKWDS